MSRPYNDLLPGQEPGKHGKSCRLEMSYTVKFKTLHLDIGRIKKMCELPDKAISIYSEDNVYSKTSLYNNITVRVATIEEVSRLLENVVEVIIECFQYSLRSEKPSISKILDSFILFGPGFEVINKESGSRTGILLYEEMRRAHIRFYNFLTWLCILGAILGVMIGGFIGSVVTGVFIFLLLVFIVLNEHILVAIQHHNAQKYNCPSCKSGLHAIRQEYCHNCGIELEWHDIRYVLPKSSSSQTPRP